MRMPHQFLRKPSSSLLAMACVMGIWSGTTGFVILPHQTRLSPLLPIQISSSSILTRNVYAPPGSGYAERDDEVSFLPDTYEPMMQYPGTMRPGRTPENIPFHDLPISDSDPDPVPWPHFQQIEWHHRWEPPHDHPIPMEDFIEMNGRWATPEMEAAMRVGLRRDVRERREQAEAGKRETVITDDDDDDFDDEFDALSSQDLPVALGDGIFGSLGSTADQAATVAATTPGRMTTKDDSDSSDDDEYDEALDDFLLDLGLDSEVDEDGPPNRVLKPVSKTDDEFEDDDDDFEDNAIMRRRGAGVTATINVDDDSDLDLGLDEEDDVDGVDTVPLEDFGENESLDNDDIFDEGGFDFNDGDFDFDGGDNW